MLGVVSGASTSCAAATLAVAPNTTLAIAPSPGATAVLAVLLTAAAGCALIDLVGVAVGASLVASLTRSTDGRVAVGASLVSDPSVDLVNLVSAPSVSAKGNAVAVAVATSASSEPASANAVIARHALLTCAGEGAVVGTCMHAGLDRHAPW
jgi:hypothetical protein